MAPRHQSPYDEHCGQYESKYDGQTAIFFLFLNIKACYEDGSKAYNAAQNMMWEILDRRTEIGNAVYQLQRISQSQYNSAQLFSQFTTMMTAKIIHHS